MRKCKYLIFGSSHRDRRGEFGLFISVLVRVSVFCSCLITKTSEMIVV